MTPEFLEIVVVFEPSHKNSIRFFESILNPPMARIFLILIVFIVASLITFQIAKRLKPTIQGYWKFNFLMVGIYNVVLLGCAIGTALFLIVLDPLIPVF